MKIVILLFLFIVVLYYIVLAIIRWPIILIVVISIVAISIILEIVKEKKNNFLKSNNKLDIIRHSCLTEEEINNFDEKQIIDYFLKNDALLFNIVLPMYKLAVDNNYLNTKAFVELLKEAFLLDSKGNNLKEKMEHIRSISTQYYNNLKKNITTYYFSENSPSRIRSNAAKGLNSLYISRIYFGMDYWSDWRKELIETVNPVFHNPYTSKIANSFIVNTYIFTFAKMFVYKKIVNKINSYRKSDFYKILHNALYKFDTCEKVAEKTYDLFIDNFQFQKKDFSLTEYEDLLSFMQIGTEKRTKLYDKDIISKLDFDDLSKSILLQYDAAKLAKSIVYNKMQLCDNLIDYFEEYQKFDKLTSFIKKQQEKEDLLYNDYSLQNKVTIDDVDLMSGTDFELFVKKLLEKLGYKCKLTKTTGDQGIDIIAEKDKVKIAVQTKCYSNKVGNHAIMEAVAGMRYYAASKCMVITNNYFTKSAIDLANSNNVVLWDRDALVEKMYNKA